ncbi:HSP20-like chaperone [Gaertneriomyces semiglobifer]|nr:HSP20-like chaperone [Gaertneriomyces semiglobifer]
MSRLLPRLWSDLSRDFASFEAPLANAADRFLYGRSPASHALHPSNHFFRPATDIAETPQAYVIETELPGAKKEDVDVDVDGNTVTIRGRIDTGTSSHTDGVATADTPNDTHVDRSASAAEEGSSTSSSSSAAGHVNANPPATNTTYWTQERVVGTFQRSVTLPVVDASTVKTSFKNGLLSVVVPKKMSGQTHANRIPINEE